LTNHNDINIISTVGCHAGQRNKYTYMYYVHGLYSVALRLLHSYCIYHHHSPRLLLG